jgi:anti-sigma factor RsiW
MKPCSRNRKPLAWLALGELDARRAGELRAHIETCDGCHRYLAEISSVTEGLTAAAVMPDLQTSEVFHRRLVTRLRAEQAGSAWQTLVGRFNWRVALPAVGAAAVVIVMLSALARQPSVLPPAPTIVQAAPSPNIASDLSPTIANYQRIASHSLDDFDELLTQQSERNPSPTHIYTASLFALAQVPE